MKLNMQVWHASCARIFWKSWPWYLRSSVWQRFFGPFMGTFWGCYTRTLTLEDTFVYIYICVIICEFIELFVYVFVFLFSDVKDSFIYLFIIYLFIIYLFMFHLHLNIHSMQMQSPLEIEYAIEVYDVQGKWNYNRKLYHILSTPAWLLLQWMIALGLSMIWFMWWVILGCLKITESPLLRFTGRELKHWTFFGLWLTGNDLTIVRYIFQVGQLECQVCGALI